MPTQTERIVNNQSCGTSLAISVENGESKYSRNNGIATKEKCVIGLISDVQFADVPDTLSYQGIKRYYRETLNCLERAVMDWNETGIDLAINCGDIVDMRSRKNGMQYKALKSVLEKFEKLKVPTYHMLGNHCVCCFNRSLLIQSLKINDHLIMDSDVKNAYYSVSPISGWRLMMLDTTDICIYYPKTHPKYLLAEKMLNENNPNQDKQEVTGLVGLERRYSTINGAIGAEQMMWLENELAEARSKNEKCLIFYHIPILPALTFSSCLLWNFQDILTIFYKYKDVVKATFCGHTHNWSYKVDEEGIHHLILPGVVETPPGINGYGFLYIYKDKLVIRGFNRREDVVINI